MCEPWMTILELVPSQREDKQMVMAAVLKGPMTYGSTHFSGFLYTVKPCSNGFQGTNIFIYFRWNFVGANIGI